MKHLWKDKKGYNMPDWFDIIFSIAVGIIIFFGFISLGTYMEGIIQGRAQDAQQDITDAYNLINYLRTEVRAGPLAGMTLGELLVHVYHDPELDSYHTWAEETQGLLNRVFGEDNWYLTIRFPDPTHFFDDDGEATEVASVHFPGRITLSGARVTSAMIPTMSPGKDIEILLHIRED